MSQSFELRKATRQGVKPLIGLYSESGCGKTYSSLLLARGFVGPSGKIILADTESGRGELYADVIPGGYQVVRHDGPFTPASHIDLVDFIENAGAQIGILDSGSHEWEGISGVLDMAVENEARSGKPGLHNWKLPKLEHQKFMLRLLRSSIPWIICLRAKHKSRQIKENGKTHIVKDDFTTPIQADDFIFEMTVHGEIMPDHSFRLTKCSHPDLRKCFPSNGPIAIEHGKLLSDWCNGATANPQPDTKALKQQLWKLTEPIHHGEQRALSQWLVDEAVIAPTEQLAELSAERLAKVIEKASEKLSK